MASYERTLDLVQGYNFKKDVQKPFGYITSLTIGGTGRTGGAIQGLATDQIVAMPILSTLHGGEKQLQNALNSASESSASLAVVSVLKSIKWELGDTDPISFEGTLSVSGKQQVMGLLYSTMISTAVQISYVIYEYDPLSFSYYQAFSDKATTIIAKLKQAPNKAVHGSGVTGLLKKDGDNLALTVSPDPSTEVQSPENYDFSISVAPAPIPQTLFLATANKRTVTKQWGRQGSKVA